MAAQKILSQAKAWARRPAQHGNERTTKALTKWIQPGRPIRLQGSGSVGQFLIRLGEESRSCLHR